MLHAVEDLAWRTVCVVGCSTYSPGSENYGEDSSVDR